MSFFKEKFKFFNVLVYLESNNKEIIEKLSKDFYGFKTEDDSFEFRIQLKIESQDFHHDEIPHGKPIRQTKNSITYEKKKVRYNDYYGKVLSIYDYEKEQGIIKGVQLHKLYEITYLLVLSRVGKILDLQGLHKLHAFGVSVNNYIILGMMPMRGGKSTLLFEFLKDEKTELISDDSPIITRGGKIKSFPLRISINLENDLRKIKNQKENLYEFVREFYGPKWLCSLKGIENNIFTESEELPIILFEGYRWNSEDCKIEERSKLFTFLSLGKHMVIGIGLPMILEYFWETGFEDFIRKAKIFMSRSVAAFNLAKKSRCIKVYLGRDHSKNKQAILNYIENL